MPGRGLSSVALNFTPVCCKRGGSGDYVHPPALRVAGLGKAIIKVDRGVKRRKGGVPKLTPRYGLLIFALSFFTVSTPILSIANTAAPVLVAAFFSVPAAFLLAMLAASRLCSALPARAPLLV